MSGQGSVYRKRDPETGRTIGWVAQISLGPRTSRRYRRRIRATQREAYVALDELREELRDGMRLSKQSLGDFLRWWLDESARHSISVNTYRGYDDVIAHMQPIAGIPLREVMAEDLEAVFNRMTVRRGKVANPVSPKTVRNAQLVMRRALGMAAERGLVRRNVALQVPLRKVPDRESDGISPDQARAILAAVAGDRYEAAYALAFIGLRESEVLGLGWDDIDLDAATATVRWQLVGSGATAKRTSTLKSTASKSIVPLPPFVVDRLRAHREAQRAERPVASLDGGLVFVTPRGLAVNGSWLTKHFQSLLAAAGLPRLRIHDLRHGAATLLVGAGAHPRVAQELLRHSSSRVTMEIYSHISAGQRREAADLLEKVMGDR
jgi:integrase